MHEDYRLAYYPIGHITFLAFADDDFESSRLAAEMLYKVKEWRLKMFQHVLLRHPS